MAAVRQARVACMGRKALRRAAVPVWFRFGFIPGVSDLAFRNRGLAFTTRILRRFGFTCGQPPTATQTLRLKVQNLPSYGLGLSAMVQYVGF